MKEFTYQKGINVGGWMSQYQDLTDDLSSHLASFITEEDIDRIAQWGADHIRLPFESSAICNETYDYMEKCIEWCNRRGMGVLLDLHYIDGMSCDPLLPENPLFLPENQQRFISIWDEVSARLQTHGEGLRYELLNEVTDGTGYGWNKMYPMGVAAIRSREPNRKIYVGSNRMNDVNHLAELHLMDDPNLIYNFHYYDPHAFTHQMAPFDQDMHAFHHAYDYPCFFGEELYHYVKDHPDYVARCPGVLLTHNNREDMLRRLRPAREFIRCTGKPLYCGEFGVISLADENAASKWIHDLVGVLRQMKIGYAYWCYKVRDFGLVDRNSKVLKPELAKTLFE